MYHPTTSTDPLRHDRSPPPRPGDSPDIDTDEQMATMTMQMQMSPVPSTGMKRRHSPSLSLDLSSLPSLSHPAQPSNTLLVTNLDAPEIFQAASLESIRAAINQHATIHTFSPLKSFRRIIVSFYSVADAVNLRQVLDGETVLGNRVRVYFGTETKINPEDQHLQAPQSQKLFFISPPPSPPVGWESRNEEPPNKEVHADDLVVALSKLQAKPAADQALYDDVEGRSPISPPTVGRSRSSTLVYDPQEHGHSPDLPAIAVEDTTESPLPMTPMDSSKQFVHTARPPVELMR